MLSYKTIKNARQWQATIGLSQKAFEELSEQFSQTYMAIHDANLSEKKSKIFQPDGFFNLLTAFIFCMDSIKHSFLT